MFQLKLGLDPKHRSSYFQDNLFVNTPGARVAWARNREILQELVQLAHKHNARLMVVIIPAALQVSDRDLMLMREVGFEIDSSLPGKRVPQDLVLDFCREQEVACVDLLPAFLNSNDRELFLPKDCHWNATGNRFAFEMLKPHLEQALFQGESNR